MSHPRVLIIAGPNGSGKTTFAREYLPHEGHCLAFINADLIAVGLAPFAPASASLQAAKLMAQAIDAAATAHHDFAVETALSGRSYLGMIRDWKKAGYQVGLFFLCLPSADLAVERVRLRVQQGGHDIPEAVIRRRFAQGWTNFQSLYRPLVDEWRLYDASVLPLTLTESGENR